jgi:hypothetical protein
MRSSATSLLGNSWLGAVSDAAFNFSDNALVETASRRESIVTRALPLEGLTVVSLE